MENINDFLLKDNYCELYNSSGTIGETRLKIYFRDYIDLLYKVDCIAEVAPNYLYSIRQLKKYIYEVKRH